MKDQNEQKMDGTDKRMNKGRKQLVALAVRNYRQNKVQICF